MAGHTERLSVVVLPAFEKPDNWRTITLITIHGEVVGYAAHREMPAGVNIDPANAASITFTEARRNALLWAGADRMAKALERCIAAMEEHDNENFGDGCDTEFDPIIAEAQDALRNAGV